MEFATPESRKQPSSVRNGKLSETQHGRPGPRPGMEFSHSEAMMQAKSAAEAEFRAAMDAYKRKSGRLFPTWSEVFEVLTSLGYVQSEQAGKSATDSGR